MSATAAQTLPVQGAIERAILALAPQWAARRARARKNVLAYAGAYGAVNKGRLRKRARDEGSGNTTTGIAQKPLRDMARQLDRNHDIARGALNVMVRNIVGATGIGVEPHPLNADGSLNEPLAEQLAALHAEWRKLPEVTGELDWARSEQLLCRSWLRDGDVLWQYLEGEVPYLTHSSRVPLSLELLEADLLPTDFNDPRRNILQGIERNSWGRPVGFWIYKNHPGDPFYVTTQSLKRVPTENIGHLKLIDRVGQVRGVSMFASVLTRLDDLKDYEESERIAAKIAASMAAVIVKGDPADYNGVTADGNAPAKREMRFSPGMVFDDLRPGESISTIDAKRPNPNAATWRDGQLRAVAAGADASFSSISRNYNGSYSAQRQELVEQYSAYMLLGNAFIDQCSREVYERFVGAAVLSGAVRPPRGTTFTQLVNAMFIPPQMPWIDPQKEATAFGLLEDRAYISGPEVIRRRGGNPRETLRAEKAWQTQLREAGVQTHTQSASTATNAPASGNEDAGAGTPARTDNEETADA
jgi:lambda family phage portal protein